MKKARRTTKFLSVICVVGLLMALIGWMSGAKTGGYITSNGVVLENNQITSLVKHGLEEFSSINLLTEEATVRLIPADFYGIDMHYYGERYSPRFRIKDGVLEVEDSPDVADEPEGVLMSFFAPWDGYENSIDIYFDQSNSIENVTIETGWGNIQIDDLLAENVHLIGHAGHIFLKRISTQELRVEQGVGRFALAQSMVGKANIQKMAGGSWLEQVEGEELNFRLDVGGVTATQSSVNMLKISNRVGSVFFNDLVSQDANIAAGSGGVELSGVLNGQTHISSALGNIALSVQGQIQDYGLDCNAGWGKVDISGIRSKGVKQQGATEKKIEVDSGVGSVYLSFDPAKQSTK